MLKGWLYLWGGKQSGYKTLFENIALCSLPLNCIFLFLQLDSHHSRSGSRKFICKKKGRISLSLTETLAFKKKEYQWLG